MKEWERQGEKRGKRESARYWQCSSALRKFSTATHSTTTHSTSSHPPSLTSSYPLTPDPSSIRARFCRVHRQINGVANTGRYICPRPHRPRSVQFTSSRTPHPSSIPRARPISRPGSLFLPPATLTIPLRDSVQGDYKVSRNWYWWTDEWINCSLQGKPEIAVRIFAQKKIWKI